MLQTAILIGQRENCRQLERLLDLLRDRPVTLGWVLTNDEDETDRLENDAPTLGAIEQLEAIVARRRPALAIVSLPAVMIELITRIRTRLRRLEVPDRFIATLEDQLAGVGPRTLLQLDLAELINRSPRMIDQEAMRTLIKGKRVLITGAGGSIGSELSRLAARYDPAQLILVDRSENALFEIDRQIARLAPDLPRRAVLHDVVEAEATKAHFQLVQPELVFHAAAHKHVPLMEDHPAAAVDNNLFGTKSVVDAADAVGVERFVMISTDKAVRPRSIMGMTKRLAERYVQFVGKRSQTQFAMVRFGNVIGSTGSVLEIWAKQLADGGPLTVTDPQMTRYFMTIPEAAALVMQSAALLDTPSSAGNVFVLDMGEPLRIVDMARRFIEAHGLSARLPGTAESTSAGQIRIVFTGARPGEKLHEQLAREPDELTQTTHPDILAVRLPEPDEVQIKQMLTELSPEHRGGDRVGVAALIRRLISAELHPAAA